MRVERSFAEQGYTDLRDFTPPPPPVCAKQAEWEAQTRAEDAAKRDERIARQVVAEKADKRARCTVNWNRRFRQAAHPLLALQIELATNGFDARQLDPVLIALREALIQINQETTNG